MSIKVICVLVAGAVSVVSSSAFGSSIKRASAVRELEVHDALHINTLFQTPALSPDGRWLAYSAQDLGSRLSGVSSPSYGQVAPEIFVTVVDLKTGRKMQLGEKNTHNVYPLWSPDSRWLAYISDRDGEVRLWGWDSLTGIDRRLSASPLFPMMESDNGRNMVWSPDSKRIVSRIATPGISALTLGEKMKAADAAKTIDVFVSHASPTDEANAPKRNIDREARLKQVLFDIGVIELASGDTRLLAQEVYNNISMAISPDGTQLTYVEMDIPAAAASRHWAGLFYNLNLIALDGGEPKIIVNHNLGMSGEQAPRWSPDGTQVVYSTTVDLVLDIEGAYVASTRGDGRARLLRSGVFSDVQWSATGDSVLLVGDPNPRPVVDGTTQDSSRATPGLWHLEMNTGKLRELTPRGWGYRIQRLFSSPAGNTYWSPDEGRSAMFVARNLKTPGDSVWKVNTDTGKLQRLQEEKKRYASDRIAVSNDGTVLYTTESVQRPEDIWVTSNDFRISRQVTQLNTQLERYTFGEGQAIQYRSSGQGEELLGTLVLPAGYVAGRRYPLITIIYPGDFSRVVAPGQLLNFMDYGGANSPNPQLFTTRGYAVLYPAAPQRFGTPMRDMADAILPAIDKAIEIGVADPDRLGIQGHSYGGYSTYAMIVQSPRFKAAVASAGTASMVSSWFSLQPGSDWSFGQLWSTGQGKIAGSFWQRRDQYFENSPVFHLDRVQTPLLIIHGKDDATVPFWHGDEVFAGLKSLGKEVEYRRYYGENHMLMKEDNIVDALEATLRWFATYLKRSSTEASVH